MTEFRPPLSQITVDLSAPPRNRWSFHSGHVRAARDLIRIYNDDLEVDEEIVDEVTEIAPDVIPAEFMDEMDGLADRIDATLSNVLLANLHYDMLKVMLGCTAFAVETPSGPLHARNLDWWTHDRVLHDATVVTRFIHGPAGEFFTVGWPAFVGALSGMATERFAITLNDVLGEETGQVALPVVILLRQVLQDAKDFDEAVERLSHTPIASDCLLLVSGCEPDQRIVIERTPTQHAHRTAPADEPLRVANDYLAIETDIRETTSELMRTSCSRYERISQLLEAAPPTDLTSSIDRLSDDQVQMSITVQQMAFRAKTGEILVRVT